MGEHDALLAVVERIYPLGKALRDSLVKHSRPVSFEKGKLLLSEGQVSTKMYFIHTGLVRGYYVHNLREANTGFMAEMDFVISPVSFYSQQPSYEFLEVVEPAHLLEISLDKLNHLYDTFPEFNLIGRKITESYYLRSELRAHHLRTQTAEERYNKFLHDYGRLLNRLSNKHIASFLGLSQETVSRIRAKKK